MDNLAFMNSELVAEFYTKDNYKIEYATTNNNICAIYFSSNGIYSPDTEEAFTQTIVVKDRYEWFKTRIDYASKHIFVRDIYKMWYVKGINSTYNTVEKVLDLLKMETAGYEVITMGNSSGGYMATLMGVLLKAKVIFNFSGQFSLDYYLKENNPDFVQYLYDNKTNIATSKYYNIVKLVEDSKIPIIYFYPGNVEMDIYQMNLIKHCKNVLIFKFISSIHGRTSMEFNIKNILNRDLEELSTLHKIYLDKSISRIQFSLKVSGLLGTGMSLLSLVKNRFFRRN